MKLFHLFMHIGNLLQERVRTELADLGVHHGQGRVLTALARHNSLSQVEIANGLHLSRATITSMITRMEQAGLVSRRPDPNDHRVWRVHLTPAGRRAGKQVVKVWEGVEKDLRRILAGQDQQVLQQLLIKTRNGLGGEDPGI